MDGFFSGLQKIAATPVNIDIWQMLFTLILSTVLALAIGILYVKTFKGTFYSQSFVQTLVIVAVVISMIILVVGSNIASAFSLAGALSIIRFRSAIRDPKDVAFIFFAMGTGLACGTRYYLTAIIFVLIVGMTIILFNVFNFGKKDVVKKQLKVTMPETMNQEGAFDDVFAKYLYEHTLIGIRTVSLGTLYELRFSIMMKSGASEKALLDEIRTRNGNLNVSILLEQQMLDY